MSLSSELHLNSDGIAICDRGPTLAVTTKGQPTNELDILRLDTRELVTLVHPHRSAVLMDPAFSPSGTKLSFVVGGQVRTGPSEIWTVDLDTMQISTVSDRDRSVRRPSYSHDGQRLLFFKDISVDPPDQRPGQSEDRRNPFALHEHVMETGATSRLYDRPFAGLGRVFSVGQTDSLYYSFSIPLEPAEDGSWRTGNYSNVLEYEAAVKYANVFVGRPGQELEMFPRPAVPRNALTVGSALISATAAGRAVLLKVDPSVPDRPVFYFSSGNAEAVDLLLSVENYIPEQPAVSLSGSIIPAMFGGVAVGNPSNSSDIIVHGPDDTVRISVRDAASSSLFELNPPSSSTLFGGAR